MRPIIAPQVAKSSGLPVLFARGFRPFFLLAGLYAVISLGAWVALFRGWVAVPTGFSPPFWHAHEMLFGYTVAAIAGFLMTAVPNWTGTAPMQGWPLAGLVALWLAGRIAIWAAPGLPIALVAVVDLAFLPALAVMMGRVLWRTRNPRNLAFVVLLTVLFLANLHSYVRFLGDHEDRGLIVAIDAVTLLIVMIGGRITPNFTASFLLGQEDAPPVVTYRWLERLSLLSVLAVLIADLLPVPPEVRGAAALLAGTANAARLVGYRSGATLRQPLLWVLHLGYGWAVLGLLLKGGSAFLPALPETAALHALTVGAIGTMTLGVMSRASLGHTGRPLVAPVPIVIAYCLVSAAALIRVFAIVLVPSMYMEAIVASGTLWVAAFALFVGVFTPMLTRPRPDGREG